MTGEDSEREPAAPAADPRLGEGLFEESMGPGSALAHLYRGEIHRMKLWRERLDRTTNWAVIVMAAILTWAFSSETNPHYLILVGGAILAIFLGIEARRYQGYDIWRSRVRTIQANVVSVGLDPSGAPPDPDWRRRLSEDYRTPAIKISLEEAVAHRLRRVYLPLFLVLLVAWIVRVTAFSDVAWPTSAAVGSLPGTVVTALVATGYVVALAVTFRPRTWHTRGELLERDLRAD